MTAGSSSVPAIKAFCVGQAKSGTASLAALLAAKHRAAHEPEREQILAMILRESCGNVSKDFFNDYLIARDQRLNLEYDIAWANQFLIDYLLKLFPNARFIVLVRDPYTWLQSIVGHQASRHMPPDVRAFLDWWFRPNIYPHTRQDQAMKEIGLCSVAAFLNAWNRHISICTQLIPPSRRLILKTHELGRSHQQLADFLEIPLGSFDVKNGHVNRGTGADRIGPLIDHGYVAEMVASICAENTAHYFPNVAGFDDAYKLWEPWSSKEKTFC